MQVSIVTYNSTISACEKSEFWYEALALFTESFNRHLRRDAWMIQESRFVCVYTPRTWQWNMNHLLKMVTFHCHVGLPGGYHVG